MLQLYYSAIFRNRLIPDGVSELEQFLACVETQGG